MLNQLLMVMWCVLMVLMSLPVPSKDSGVAPMTKIVTTSPSGCVCLLTRLEKRVEERDPILSVRGVCTGCDE